MFDNCPIDVRCNCCLSRNRIKRRFGNVTTRAEGFAKLPAKFVESEPDHTVLCYMR